MASPTVRRRRLGDRLRTARQAAGITGPQAAGQLGAGWSQSKVSRIESGEVSVSPADLAGLCELYGIDDRDELRDLAHEGGERGWWYRYGLARGYANFVGFEAEATRIDTWTPTIVPGHLQTEAYMRAVMTGVGPVAAAEVDRAVEVRLERQRQITKSSPTVRALLDESVLWRVVGDPRVMVDQYRRLIDSPAAVRLLPYERGVLAVNVGGFTIFGYDDMEPVVWGESAAGDASMELERPGKCVAAFERLWQRALDPGDTEAALRDAWERST